MSLQTVLTVVYFILALLPAIVLHELSHGLVADRMGDPTARNMGRLTLNPVKHIDPFGTVILPGLLLLPRLFGQFGTPVFGYAKPMPFNPQNLRDPDRQTMWIALAGPLTNLFLAFVGALGLRLAGGIPALSPPGAIPGLADLLFTVVLVNVLLAVFNVLPLPPLDGSKVLARFLPPRARQLYVSWEAYGALFLLVIFFIFPGAIFGFITPIVEGLLSLLVG
jgi:Zn-dependent protease